MLISYYKYNEEERVLKLINGIKNGLQVVLVCDAGTPCISDPGYKLVSEAHNQGLSVRSIPGPSALNNVITLSGFPTDKFIFSGYLSKTLQPRI